MFDAKTEIVQLESRLGRVGSIQAWDPWDSRRSVADAKWWVSKIARLSHGLGEAEDFEAHFDRVVNQMKHGSVLEFVPRNEPVDTGWKSLPRNSLRHFPGSLESGNWSEEVYSSWANHPTWRASAFLVEAPIFVARQWMRHRSFAYLEMSRRYTKGSRVAWEYYSDTGTQAPIRTIATWDQSGLIDFDYLHFHQACEAEYLRRLSAGWPNEIARGCMPMEAMTRFWVAGFDRDWEAFLKLRDDAHAQPEIRVFASWIRSYLETKKVGAA